MPGSTDISIQVSSAGQPAAVGQSRGVPPAGFDLMLAAAVTRSDAVIDAVPEGAGIPPLETLDDASAEGDVEQFIGMLFVPVSLPISSPPQPPIQPENENNEMSMAEGIEAIGELAPGGHSTPPASTVGDVAKGPEDRAHGKVAVVEPSMGPPAAEAQPSGAGLEHARIAAIGGSQIGGQVAISGSVGATGNDSRSIPAFSASTEGVGEAASPRATRNGPSEPVASTPGHGPSAVASARIAHVDRSSDTAASVDGAGLAGNTRPVEVPYPSRASGPTDARGGSARGNEATSWSALTEVVAETTAQEISTSPHPGGTRRTANGPAARFQYQAFSKVLSGAGDGRGTIQGPEQMAASDVTSGGVSAPAAATPGSAPAGFGTRDPLNVQPAAPASVTTSAQGPVPVAQVPGAPAEGVVASPAQGTSASQLTFVSDEVARTEGAPDPIPAGQVHSAVMASGPENGSTGTSSDPAAGAFASQLEAARGADNSAPAQPASPSVESGRMANQLLQHVSRLSFPARARMTVRLEPESLGKVELRLSLRDGALDLDIQTHLTRTLELVEAALPRLRSSLEDRGIEIGRLTTGSGDPSAAGLAGGNQNSSGSLGDSPSGWAPVSRSAPLELVTEDRPALDSLPAHSGSRLIDYRV